MGDVLPSFEARKKYRHFRVLVIGRANAGKTTLLQRVCNTTNEPCIYDEGSNNLLEPTVDRGIHDIDRPFAFANNPQFIFHDSPGFEAGDESQLKKVQAFIEKRARSTEVDDQLHAIWFCFVPNNPRFLLGLEERFFNEQRAGNVPVIAIFTKFDDLINQVYDEDLGEEASREIAARLLKDNLQGPLFKYKYPPRACVCLEDMHEDGGDHQEYVKELIKKTADSLDDLALKILFISLQKNNLELCLHYAVEYAPDLGKPIDMMNFVQSCLLWFRHSYYKFYYYGKTEGDDLNRRLDLFSPQQLQQINMNQRFSQGLHRYQLSQNSEEVTAIMKEIYENPSMDMFAALIICLENSFWYQSASVSFTAAFCKALESYKKTGTKEKVEIALEGLEVGSGQKAFGPALTEILLKHRLTHSDNSNPQNDH